MLKYGGYPGESSIKICLKYEMNSSISVKAKASLVPAFKDVNWIAKLAYLSDIFSIFNDLNVCMQGKNATCFSMADKIEGQNKS